MSTRFETLYGQPPQWLARAPGRVNLIGEHTDYNDGFVLPMAIELATTIHAAPNHGAQIRIASDALSDRVHIDLDAPIRPQPGSRWNHVCGVLALMRDAGFDLRGFDALIESTVPAGSGLSSSAALEVAVATLIEAMNGRQLDPVDKALLCQRAEREFAGVPCGIMDQFISAQGRADQLLLLDCRSLEAQWISLNDPAVSVLIFQSNVRHEHAGGEYALRRTQCAQAAAALGVHSLRDADADRLAGHRDIDPLLLRRARHVVSENTRTLAFAQHLRRREWRQAGECMYASHASLRDDFEVSCRELDALVEIARTIGASAGMYGCRMTGGGFGGCAVALVAVPHTAQIAHHLCEEYRRVTGIEPQCFISRPAPGASATTCPTDHIAATTA